MWRPADSSRLLHKTEESLTDYCHGLVSRYIVWRNQLSSNSDTTDYILTYSTNHFCAGVVLRDFIVLSLTPNNASQPKQSHRHWRGYITSLNLSRLMVTVCVWEMVQSSINSWRTFVIFSLHSNNLTDCCDVDSKYYWVLAPLRIQVTPFLFSNCHPI